MWTTRHNVDRNRESKIAADDIAHLTHARDPKGVTSPPRPWDCEGRTGVNNRWWRRNRPWNIARSGGEVIIEMGHVATKGNSSLELEKVPEAIIRDVDE